VAEAPRIVAESLIEVADPLIARLDPGAAGAPADVIAALARSLVPPERDILAPPWLRPEQAASFRRTLWALEQHGGALLADPLGSGKTYVALAIAGPTGRAGPVAVIAPAALRAQWIGAASRVGTAIEFVSHQALSRGRLPRTARRLAIVDESHHFRSPDIARYGHLARWLVGRRAVLLSATPVVNRLEDLGHQLLLTVADDTLAGHGCVSLMAALRAGVAPAGLGQLVLIRDRDDAVPSTREHHWVVQLSEPEQDLLRRVDSLALSADRGVARLIRGVLWRAMASSPAALYGALRRYARLLNHAELARAAGRSPARAEIRAFTGPDPEQLVWWELLPTAVELPELALEDREPVARLLSLVASLPAPDPKATRLRELLATGATTVVFTASRDTLAWLRVVLADHRPAWVTGAAAGVGPCATRRELVLGAFAPGPAELAPRLLLATDVAAEGLDLQRASRIVHYDLPWTSVRLDQRVGRVARLGSIAAEVEVVRLEPPPELEQRLNQVEVLAAKRGLGRRAGLDLSHPWLFRWRNRLTQLPERGSPGFTVVQGEPEGWLFGLALDRGPGTKPGPAVLLWSGADGTVVDDPAILLPRLLRVARSPGRPATGQERQEGQRWLTPLVRQRLRQARSELWSPVALRAERRGLASRLARLSRDAARRRDRACLADLGQVLGRLSGGLTAGELLLIRDSLGLPGGKLLAALRPLVGRPNRGGAPTPRLTGVVRVCAVL
jgi:hypothetical protein